MAEHMDYFHNHFRETWNVMYAACESGKRAKGMSIRQFIAMGQQFCGSLEMHHGIEERYVSHTRLLVLQSEHIEILCDRVLGLMVAGISSPYWRRSSRRSRKSWSFLRSISRSTRA